VAGFQRSSAPGEELPVVERASPCAIAPSPGAHAKHVTPPVKLGWKLAITRLVETSTTWPTAFGSVVAARVPCAESATHTAIPGSRAMRRPVRAS